MPSGKKWTKESLDAHFSFWKAEPYFKRLEALRDEWGNRFFNALHNSADDGTSEPSGDEGECCR